MKCAQDFIISYYYPQKYYTNLTHEVLKGSKNLIIHLRFLKSNSVCMPKCSYRN